MRRPLAVVATLALALAPPLAAQVAQGTFSFRSEQVGQRTPITLVAPPRLTATFATVNGAPTDFRVEHNFISGNPFFFLLYSADSTSSDLFVRFSEPLSRARVHVGLNTTVGAPDNLLTVTRFIRTAIVGTTTVPGALLPDGRFPEVTVEVGGDGRVFDGLAIASPAGDMALGYVWFSIGDPVSVVPEPAAAWLLAAGGTALVVVARRRREARRR